MNDNTLVVIVGLSGYLVLSHLFFLYVINKLVNKLMSRSYFEYQQKPHVPKDKVVLDNEPMDYIGRIFS